MIKLTKRDGHDIYLNEDLIEAVEANPDTIITLNNDNRYLVYESVTEIIDRIIEFKASILRRAGQRPGTKVLSEEGSNPDLIPKG
ncbi:MAG: flagellar FlbD family protein [Deltaproteobacteria bacterium]|nr:flagellar FlbD family protein [Deltaproteobacteria bacterium]